MKDILIEKSWKDRLENQFSLPYFNKLKEKVKSDHLEKTIFPNPKNIFRAFDLCHFEDVSVVIIGQDPYHGLNQANGLSFAVSENAKLPPSLKNIFKEIESDINCKCNLSGDLSRWAKQGVLMLNAILTVIADSPASHRGIGWEQFTDSVIQTLSNGKKEIVYLLWGNYAQKKGSFINTQENLVLTSTHPSPFSAHSGFFGCKHFSKCNDYLIAKGKKPIDWR